MTHTHTHRILTNTYVRKKGVEIAERGEGRPQDATNTHTLSYPTHIKKELPHKAKLCYKTNGETT